MKKLLIITLLLITVGLLVGAKYHQSPVRETTTLSAPAYYRDSVRL